ncbi:YdeI/OmpD-associated family protein [Arthrobacter sedimenti]|uniref:YdeI/OmpD-associated family protein n=1 Tax=Arthrobacter sedimenti TaxID=2694931 RepID=UPI000B358655|nr:YdeI/OmpD-associated family protein [Arthrobacter sedimenti]OUM43437.1 hypothetical protein B8W73_05920 [Arthrobacter agilis]
MKAELRELLLPDAAAWRHWLEENHETSPGVWLIEHKKGGTTTLLTYAQALDEALCFGWIDGQARARDDDSYFQRFTPRGPRSIWSIRNQGHVERLRAEGRMHEAGERAIAAAQADGRWERAYAGPATAEVPPDLMAAIEADGAALVTFRTLSSQNRYALIFRLAQLRTDAAKERNIAKFVAMLARGETFYPQGRKQGRKQDGEQGREQGG